jgi:hypothetical protein
MDNLPSISNNLLLFVSSELDGARHINRGPAGASFAASHIHFDMLANRDEAIDFGDFLGRQ